MTTALLAGGTLTANPDDRVVVGRLYSFNEEGRTNLGRLKVKRGAFKLPADLSLMYLAEGHTKPVKGIGTGLYAQETDDGLYAAWRIEDGPKGDTLLAAWRSGDPSVPRALSVEVDDVKIRGGVAEAGVLHGASVVPAGAFASAALLAEDTPDEDTPPELETAADDLAAVAADAAPTDPPAEPTSTETQHVDTYTDEAGKTWKRTIKTTTTTEDDGNGGTKTTVTETTTLEEPEPDQPTDTPTEEPTMSVPNTLTAGKVGGKAPAASAQARIPSAREVLTAIVAVARGGASEAHKTLLATVSNEHKTLLAALNNVNGSGGNSGTANNPYGAGVMQPNWLGQLYQGVSYERLYAGLGTLGNDITYAGKKGYKLHRGTSGAPVDSYAATGAYNGQGAAIASGKFYTETASSDLHQWAMGNAVERAMIDLKVEPALLEDIFGLYIEDALVWSDDLALSTIVTAAGTPVAPVDLNDIFPPTIIDGGEDPDTIVPSPLVGKYPPAVAYLIQGILAVKAKKADNRRDVPTFAIVNDKALEQLSYTPFEAVLDQFKFSITTDSTGTVDGIQIVAGDIGIEDTPAVIVGSGKAVEFDEPAGGPLQIDALDIANGNVDRAIHGYFQTFTPRPQAVVLVGVADD